MSGANQINLTWRSPGPVASKFMASTEQIEIINGPVGSGKTTTAMVKAVKLARNQKPSRRDGRRKFKLCCVRDTYRNIWRTTLPSWFKRFPRDVGDFVGAKDGPAVHTILFGLPDRSIVEFIAEFVALGELSGNDESIAAAVEAALKGYEPTAFYLNELDTLPKQVFDYVQTRWGRYPDMDEGGPDWYGILADTNAPLLESWVFQDLFKKQHDGIALFRQPSGLSAQAENLDNLPPGYYESQTRNATAFQVNRMVHNIAGLVREDTQQFIAGDLAAAAAAPSREAQATLYDPLVMGVDVARFGNDQSVIRFRRGRDARSIPPIKLKGADTMALASRVFDEASRHGAAAVFVDGGGVGGGVVDRLRQMRLPGLFEIQFGAASDRADYGDNGEKLIYANKRAEMYGTMRGWLKSGAIDDDPALIGDLTAVRFGYAQREGYDAIILETKEAMKKRGLGSPDDSDALALTFAYPVAATPGVPQVGGGAGAARAEIDYDPLA